MQPEDYDRLIEYLASGQPSAAADVVLVSWPPTPMTSWEILDAYETVADCHELCHEIIDGLRLDDSDYGSLGALVDNKLQGYWWWCCRRLVRPKETEDAEESCDEDCEEEASAEDDEAWAE